MAGGSDLYLARFYRHNLIRSLGRPAVQRANLIPGGHQQLHALPMHLLAVRGQEYHRVPFHRPACAPENIRLCAFNVDLDHIRRLNLTCASGVSALQHATFREPSLAVRPIDVSYPGSNLASPSKPTKAPARTRTLPYSFI